MCAKVAAILSGGSSGNTYKKLSIHDSGRIGNSFTITFNVILPQVWYFLSFDKCFWEVY